MLRAVPVIMTAILAGPIFAGLFGFAAAAFGWAPVFGARRFSLDPFLALLAEPGISRSVWLAFWTGPVTAFISLASVVLFVAAFAGTRWFAALSALMRPVLAVPHAAAALGLAFLIAPSGFLVRLVSPGLTGFTRPPDWLIINDPAGLTMLAGLVIKEIPFLLFVTIAALPQIDPRRARVAASLGKGRVWGWLTAVFPGIYRQIRLPVFAVIAFASSVVDLAIILGPGTPASLAVRVLRWTNDPDLQLRMIAAAGALVQLGVTLCALLIWWFGEKATAALCRRIALRGVRVQRDGLLRAAGFAGTAGAALAVLAGVGLLALWSVSGPVRFPNAWPNATTFAVWNAEAANLLETAWRATLIGLIATALAVTLSIAALENSYRHGLTLSGRALLLLYVPLLVPQIAFLGGLSEWFLRLRLDGTLGAVVFVHLIVVLPYVYLTLAAPWNAFDTRYLSVARAFGKSRNAALFAIRLPILLRPVLSAFALGFAVSITQYLPTLLIGGGRQPTITTEAVALASGGHRPLIGVYGLVQALLPFSGFALAGLIPALIWRNRRALKPGGRS